MEITLARHNDLPEMITLLKSSLGEQLMPKSEELFLWKHEKNPFGTSKTFLAKEKDKIIGLRTLMPWCWERGNEKIQAVRAVDTATDPLYQGKGIFKKLTLYALQVSKDEGVDMVFNTPNPVSMAGYLKMGWEVAGRVSIYVGPGSIFPKKWHNEIVDDMQNYYPVSSFSTVQTSKDYFHTSITPDYLKWRFQECPVVKYGALIKEDFGFVFRLKKVNNFAEFRICEIWSNPASSAQRGLRSSLGSCIKKLKPIVITSAPSPLFEKKPLLQMLGPFRRGPITTVRPVSLTNMDNFINFKNWRPSIGSLELF